jgi:hypothetical protein
MLYDMTNYNNKLDGMLNSLDNIATNTGGTAYNTGVMAKSVNIADEDLRCLRDIANKEAIIRTTSTPIEPTINVYIDKVNDKLDVKELAEDIYVEFEKRVEEEYFNLPEGIYA